MTDDTSTNPELTEADALKDSYSTAQKQLREKHATEFSDLRKARMAELGYPGWKPQPTQEEKAAAEIEKLLAENPSLRKQFGLEPSATAEPAAEEPEPEKPKKAVPRQRNG